MSHFFHPRRAAVPMLLAAPAALVACLASLPVQAQLQLTSGAEELQTVTSARQTLVEFGGLQIESIPPAMLNAAEGVAIFPNMIKGGFILGVNYGKGVLMVRRPDRTWSPPVMATMGGGSLGFQAGLQAADIVLVFATPRSLQGILSGQKVTLGADASVALGPIGRQANAATDARLGAEIYSYARSRGLFLGVSVNGASLSIDDRANAMLYSRFGVTPQEVFEGRGLAYHEEVQALINDLAARTQQTAAVPQSQAGQAPQAVPVTQAAGAPQAVPVQQVPIQPPSTPVAAAAPPAAPVALPAPPAAPVAVPTPPAAPVASDPPLVPLR